MAMFDVFVDGAVDESEPARQRLAEAMSKRYGLGVPDLLARMAKGRFRVKANLDEATAKAYARDLESIGARVSVAESRATGPVKQTEPPVAPRPKGTTVRPPQAPPHARTEVSPRGAAATPAKPSPTVPPSRHAAASALPPAAQSRPQPGSSLPPATQAKPATAAPYASGLSAAYSSEIPTAGLGALDGDALSLSALDGSEDQPQPAQSSFAPPGAAAPLPASIGPAPSQGAPKAAKPKDVPLDLFAPPDAQPDAKDELLLALEEDPRQRATTPPPLANATAAKSGPISTPMLQRKSQPVPRADTPVTSVAAVDTTRWKFALGVLLAVILGFIPAHLIAGWREGKLATIDAHVLDVQSKVTRPDAPVPLAKLEEFRDDQLSKKESEQRTIALIALAIWGLAGAGIAYAWFKRPWERRSFS